jgi:hypothetical protein
MAKLLLRIAAGAMFVLACAALAFALMLFGKREELKGRVQTLEGAVKGLAQTIDSGDENSPPITLADDQLKTYRDKAGNPVMEAPLKLLVDGAGRQRDNLKRTRMTLTETQSILADTSNRLVKTQADLESTVRRSSRGGRDVG